VSFPTRFTGRHLCCLGNIEDCLGSNEVDFGNKTPLLVRRGGRDINKMPRSLFDGADGVVAYKSGFGMRF
jgi:hypothetical protein